MKGKNVARIIVLTLIFLFLGIYLMQSFGYYEYSSRKTNMLTEAEIKKFEKDVKDGKKVDASNYIKKENDYSNNLSKMSMGLSHFISDTFNGIMTYLFGQIDKTVNS